MNNEELKDFEDFFGTTEEEAINRDKYWSKANYGAWYNSSLIEYRLNKFLYPMLQQDIFGTVILKKCWEANFHVSKNDIYRFKKEYKAQVQYFTNRSIQFRQEILNKMRAREMFYPDHYDYMVDPRTINREMNALMPFKEYLFEVLTQEE